MNHIQADFKYSKQRSKYSNHFIFTYKQSKKKFFRLLFCIFILSFLFFNLTSCTRNQSSKLDSVSQDPNPNLNDFPSDSTVLEPDKPNSSKEDTLNSDELYNDNTELPDPSDFTEKDDSESVFSYIVAHEDTIEGRIKTPDGFHRIPSSSNELTGFIRNLKLKPDGSQVLLYDGNAKSNQEDHIAVFDLDVGNRDLQQCADSIIRIYAEYFWSQKDYDAIAFHLTNGFFMEYTQWQDGNRILVDGNHVQWKKSAEFDDSYQSFRKYLDMVYAYAGTLSLSKESTEIEISDILPGDMFIEGGSPGHCVLVVDIAENESGERCYLLAQGYMPAQDFHVLKNPLHPEDPWYYASEFSFPLKTPTWTFDYGSLKRWSYFPLAEASESIPTMSDKIIEERSDANQVTLLAVGDNLIHIEVVNSGKKEDGSYQYDHLYSRVKDIISAADIAIINQETILGGPDFSYSGYPNFNSPREIGDAIIKAGFDVVLHATNHTMDKGSKAVFNTFDYWSQHPDITVLGINKTEEDSEKIPIIEKNGIKIAMLNYTYGLNGYSLPDQMPYLVNMLNKKKMKEDILKAKEEADFVIVFPHWGKEYVYEATKEQSNLTEFFYNLGVDLVIGTHPHVLQPVEWIETTKNHRMLVYYSLGNFISYQKEAPRMLGGMANITIAKDKQGTYISDASITPIVTHYEHGPADYNYGIYTLNEYSEELAQLHGVSDIAKNGDLIYEDIKDLARQVLKDWYE